MQLAHHWLFQSCFFEMLDAWFVVLDSFCLNVCYCIFGVGFEWDYGTFCYPQIQQQNWGFWRVCAFCWSYFHWDLLLIALMDFAINSPDCERLSAFAWKINWIRFFVCHRLRSASCSTLTLLSLLTCLCRRLCLLCVLWLWNVWNSRRDYKRVFIKPQLIIDFSIVNVAFLEILHLSVGEEIEGAFSIAKREY